MSDETIVGDRGRDRLPAQPLGLREGFWGAITALAVAQAEFGAARSVARDQFVGAAIGGVVAVAISLVITPDLMGYAVAVLLAILACWLVNVASAARLSAITATIILLVPHTGTPQRMLISRVFEVGCGICAAIGTVWVVARINRRLGWTIEAGSAGVTRVGGRAVSRTCTGPPPPR